MDWPTSLARTCLLTLMSPHGSMKPTRKLCNPKVQWSTRCMLNIWRWCGQPAEMTWTEPDSRITERCVWHMKWIDNLNTNLFNLSRWKISCLHGEVASQFGTKHLRLYIPPHTVVAHHEQGLEASHCWRNYRTFLDSTKSILLPGSTFSYLQLCTAQGWRRVCYCIGRDRGS